MYRGEFGCAVTHDPDIPAVVMIWKGYATSSQFRSSNERILASIVANSASCLLGDVTDFVLIGAEDQEWLNHSWIPRAMQAGLKRCALVQPVYYFNRVAVENVGRRIDSKRLELAYFSDFDAARSWLARSDRPPSAR